MATGNEWHLAFNGLTAEAETLMQIVTGAPVRSLMRELDLTGGPDATDLFLTFRTLQRNQIERVEVIDLYIPDIVAFESGTFHGRQVLEAIDLTHADSDLPVVAFYTAGNTPGLHDVYIAGHGGVAATGRLAMFFMRTSATSMELSRLDTSRVTDMSSMFWDTGALTSLNLSGWDTSNVTNMEVMFAYTSSLTNLNLSGWDTSSVTAMGGVFWNASALTTVNLSGWDTSSVTDMSGMFWSASALTTLDLSGWDTSNVTTMSSMFNGVSALTRIDGLSGWDTSSVTDMQQMFDRAGALTSLDLSSFDTSNVTNMAGMFRHTSSLTTVDFRSATFGSDTENHSMFIGSGIDTMIVGSTAAQTWIQARDGWSRTPARTITLAS
jgi:surface protein